MSLSTLAALAAAGAAAQSASAAAAVVTEGHLDYGARLIDGELRSHVKDGTTTQVVWREPADVLVSVGPQAKTTVPANPLAAGLGTPGAAVWVMAQTQQAGVPWLGWNTESLTSAQLSGPIRWSLDSAVGPGSVTLFQSGAFGAADVLFDSSDGLPDARDVPLGAHAHGNWTFSARGRYALTFTMRASTPGGRQLHDTRTLAISVDEAAAGAAGEPSVPPGGRQPLPGGSGSQSAPGAPAPSAARPFQVKKLSLAGRTLTLQLRHSTPGRVRVKVRRGGRTVASSKPVSVKGRHRTAKLRLTRRLGRGTYRVQVTVIPADRRQPATKRSLKLKVR